MSLYDTIKTASKMTDTVLVSFSGGKDSVVCLDICTKLFSSVQGFFMYYVKNLSFQENIIRFYESKYGIPIHRIPHFELSLFLKYGSFCLSDDSVPEVKVNDTYEYIRNETGIHWIAGGERIADSIWRRAMIKQTGTIDQKRGRIYPVAEWRKDHILSYMKQNKLNVGLDSQKLGFSFRSFAPKELIMIKETFPEDYERIKEAFPFVEASIIQNRLKREKNEREKQISEI